jgi:hypothetical protein
MESELLKLVKQAPASFALFVEGLCRSCMYANPFFKNCFNQEDIVYVCQSLSLKYASAKRNVYMYCCTDPFVLHEGSP